MNVLLLGNGFDIYHKLPTKYSNFLNTVDFLCHYYDDTKEYVGNVFSDSQIQILKPVMNHIQTLTMRLCSHQY